MTLWTPCALCTFYIFSLVFIPSNSGRSGRIRHAVLLKTRFFMLLWGQIYLQWRTGVPKLLLSTSRHLLHCFLHQLFMNFPSVYSLLWGNFPTQVRLFRRYLAIVTKRTTFSIDFIVGNILPSQPLIFAQCSLSTAWISLWRWQPASLNMGGVMTVTRFNICAIKPHPSILLSHYPKNICLPRVYFFPLPLLKQSFPRQSFRDVTQGVCKCERRAP